MGRLTRKLPILLAAFVCALLSGGCYTQLMMYQGETPASGYGGSGNKAAADCGDCEEQVPYASARREVCVWERDILGFPELRCYNTNYASSWVYFHHTPWWYRSSYGWYDTRGCPPYYYYDRISGMCRYIGGSHRPGTGGGGGGGVTERQEPPPKRNSRITTPPGEAPPAEAPAAVGGPMIGTPIGTPLLSGGGIKQLSPAGAPATSTPPATTTTQTPGQTLTKPQDGASGQSSSQTQQQTTEERKAKDETPKESPPPKRNSRIATPPSQQTPSQEEGHK